MNKVSATVALLLVAVGLSAPGAGESYRYVKAADLAARLSAKDPVVMVDIQAEPEYAQRHIKGVIPTYAYPVKSDAERSRIEAVVSQLQASSAPVVVVCPRGGGGAERAYDLLREKGVAPERLYILEKGQAGWTYGDLTEGK